MFVKKWPLEYQKVIKTYLPTYLWDSSDSHDRSDSSDSSVKWPTTFFFTKKLLNKFTFFSQKKTFFKLFSFKNFFHQNTQNAKIHKISNCDKTKNLKLWWNSKSQILMKPKNSNCDETQKLKLWWISNTQIVTKLKNSFCDENQIVMKLKNSNCDETPKVKFWRNSKTQIVKTSITQNVTKLKFGQN